MQKSDNKTLGNFGELVALEYLETNKYKIVNKNYRVGKFGEIDIIAWENEYICFIEVKTRSSTYFGSPCESVNKRKQQKIIKLAQIYLSNNKLHKCNVRFDIIEILAGKKNNLYYTKEVNILKNAF